jgi:hypothetical protein
MPYKHKRITLSTCVVTIMHDIRRPYGQMSHRLKLINASAVDKIILASILPFPGVGLESRVVCVWDVSPCWGGDCNSLDVSTDG